MVRNTTVWQSGVYAAALAAAGALAAIAQIVLAQNMDISDFAAFGFAFALLQFGAMFFEFGLYVPASRMAAAAEDAAAARELIGGALVTYLPIGLGFTLLIAGVAPFVDDAFNVDAGSALMMTAPLAIVYPFTFVGQQLAQGIGRLHLFSLTFALGNLLFFVAVLGLSSRANVSSTLALGARSAALCVASFALVWALRPVFRRIRSHGRALVRGAWDYGFRVYVGRVLSIGTYNMDVLMLAALTDTVTVAAYTLARTLASAVGLPVTGAASALFPQMTRGGGLDLRWIWRGSAVAGGLAAFLALFAPEIVALLFSDNLERTAQFVAVLGLAEAIRSVTGIYNAYLAAQGAGRALQRAGVVLTLSNLALNLTLIPAFGGIGAAWASVGALIANLVAHVQGYRRMTGSQHN